jgi:hypothetical protein
VQTLPLEVEAKVKGFDEQTDTQALVVESAK